MSELKGKMFSGIVIGGESAGAFYSSDAHVINVPIPGKMEISRFNRREDVLENKLEYETYYYEEIIVRDAGNSKPIGFWLPEATKNPVSFIFSELIKVYRKAASK